MSDGLGFLSYFDFVSFAPTSLLIILAPGHFFRRVPIIIRSKSPIYKTPIKFVTAGCTLIVALGYLLGKTWNLTLPWSRQEAIFEVSVIIISTPIWIFAICVVNRLLLSLLYCFGDNPLFRNEAAIPTSFSTYRRINFAHYIWSMMYFS